MLMFGPQADVVDVLPAGAQWLRLHGSRLSGRAPAVQRVFLQADVETRVCAAAPLSTGLAVISMFP